LNQDNPLVKKVEDTLTFNRNDLSFLDDSKDDDLRNPNKKKHHETGDTNPDEAKD
jgi:hypothetical protein